ncbi:MAG: hypothetical protein Q7Q71_05485 [Verrucomicrobiota bacterium JB023]|nr:hypothetical protein [Verrucomicrobiota bacterium JB023]
MTNATIVVVGSILVLFPSWLPRATPIGVDLENSAVELLQLALLLVSMALCLAASSHAGRFRPIYQTLSLGCLAAAIGESTDWLRLIIPFNPDLTLIPVFGMMIILLVNNPRETLRFVALSARHPASGFLAAALIIIYVFARFFGSKTFWQNTLEGDVPANLPKICSAYLELLACYFFFVGAVGFTFTLRRNREDL